MSEQGLPRGLRNMNPGNIRLSGVRYKGEVRPSGDHSFRQFESMAWGYRAMFVLLHTYAVKHGCNTIRSMISRYAPPSENDTDAYVRRVVRGSGTAADAPLDTLDGEVMRPIVAAMSAVENGLPAHATQVAEGWRLFAADFHK